MNPSSKAGELKLHDRREPAIDQPLAVERHRVLLRIDPVVALHELVHSAHCGVAGRLVGPFDPGEDNGLVLVRLDGLAEVRELAVAYIVAPTFENARGAELLEHAVSLV